MDTPHATKARKLIGSVEKPWVPPFQYQAEGGTREGGTCAIQVRVAAGEALDQRGLSVPPGEGRDWLGGGPTQSTGKFRKLIGLSNTWPITHPNWNSSHLSHASGWESLSLTW